MGRVGGWLNVRVGGGGRGGWGGGAREIEEKRRETKCDAAAVIFHVPFVFVSLFVLVRSYFISISLVCSVAVFLLFLPGPRIIFCICHQVVLLAFPFLFFTFPCSCLGRSRALRSSPTFPRPLFPFFHSTVLL